MSYRQLPGQPSAPDDKPQHVEPVPEHYKGVNFPYRGTEQHGVAVPDDSHYDSLGIIAEMDDPADFMGAEPEPDPILVRVVNKTPRERRDWRPLRFLAKQNGQQIVGRLESRSQIRLRNLDAANAVYIGNDQGVTAFTGYKLPAGVEIAMVTTEDIWVCTGDASEVEVAVISEFAVAL